MTQFCRKLLRFILLLLPLSFLVPPANATTIVMLSDTELIVTSRLIVSGRVVQVTNAREESTALVWTYIEVQTDRVLKGELPGETIVLKELGGSFGSSGLRVFGQPEFTRGERLLLYLNTGVDGSLHAAHASVGKFSIAHDQVSGRDYVERTIEGGEVGLLARTDGAEITNRASLDSYIEKIAGTLQREALAVSARASAESGQPLVAIPNEYSRIRKKSREFSPQFVLSGPARWMEADSGQSIRYYVNPNNSPIAGGAAGEIARAMAAWPGQSSAMIRLEAAGQAGSCGIVQDNLNTISFGDCLNQLDPPVGCAGVVALTAMGWIPDGRVIGGVSFNRIVEADVVFNKGMDCFLSNSANLAEVATHELGHSIGLAHSADPSAIMWAVTHGHGRDATLGADDKAGVLSIYPASGGPGSGGSPVNITSSSLSSGTVGQAFNSSLTATGGTQPYRWNIVGGGLPPGLNLSTSGSVTGIPVSSGLYSFTAQVTDSGSPVRADVRTLAITIQPGGAPRIERVKLKGERKLRVFGANFRSDSIVVINGVVFDPVSVEPDGTAILVKGSISLGPQGTNVLMVINRDSNSQSFVF